MIRGIRPTSKSSLKLQCLWASKGDVNEAQKLYDYFADGLEGLPEHDPVPATWTENTRDVVNGIMGWMKENQDALAHGYEFIRGIISNKGLPSLSTESASESVALPEINE